METMQECYCLNIKYMFSLSSYPIDGETTNYKIEI